MQHRLVPPAVDGTAMPLRRGPPRRRAVVRVGRSGATPLTARPSGTVSIGSVPIVARGSKHGAGDRPLALASGPRSRMRPLGIFGVVRGYPPGGRRSVLGWAAPRNGPRARRPTVESTAPLQRTGAEPSLGTQFRRSDAAARGCRLGRSRQSCLVSCHRRSALVQPPTLWTRLAWQSCGGAAALVTTNRWWRARLTRTCSSPHLGVVVSCFHTFSGDVG
jgi:hypothetical protein